MTANQFARECAARCVPPALAVENPKVRRALKRRDDDAVRRALNSEF